MDKVVADIQVGHTNVYAVSKKFLDDIRPNYASYTLQVYRSYLPGLWESVLGNFSKTVFDRLCPPSPSWVSKVKQSPSREKIVEMLRLAYPLHRAILCALAVSGMRISECLSRTIADLEIRPSGYARVRLQAQSTKSRYLRYTFLTKECVDFVMEYRKAWGVKSEFLFPGDTDNHLHRNVMDKAMKKLYRRVGLHDAPDKSEIYCTHSLRTAAGDMLRDCGMSEKYVLAIIGHKNSLGAESHYLDWKKIEANWVEHCAEKMRFLDNSAPLQSKVAELTRANGKLELLLERLLERLT